MADQLQELEELAAVDVSARNRSPGAATRFSRGKDVLAPGSFLPRVQSLLNPRLFRERGDTNALVRDAFAEGGPLAALAESNPAMVAEIRQQADTPMQPQEHKQFRSALLGLIGGEVEREGKIRAQIMDNEGFMAAFSALDSAIPGIKDPNRHTFEESERRQIAILYDQAQRLALLDPDASKAAMVEVRKKADLLTGNVRQLMGQTRKRATLEDTELYNASDNALQMLRDASQELVAALEAGSVPDFVLDKALTAYGAASAVAAPNLSDAASAAVSGAASGGVEGARSGLRSLGIGLLVGAAVEGVQAGTEFFRGKAKTQALVKHLENAKAQVEQNYAANRQKLQERYAPLGIELGEQPGEVYAVLDEAYSTEAEKIPAAMLDKQGEQTDRTRSLRVMLDDELAAADDAVERLRPDAAANIPGAAARLASAITRQQTAQDDLAIFEDDLRQAAGVEMSSIPGIDVEQAGSAIEQARRRRQIRSDTATRSQIRTGIMEALRGHTR